MERICSFGAVDLIFNETWFTEKKSGGHESHLPLLNGGKSTKCIHSA